jgi:hypothetical protein
MRYMPDAPTIDTVRTAQGIGKAGKGALIAMCAADGMARRRGVCGLILPRSGMAG